MLVYVYESFSVKFLAMKVQNSLGNTKEIVAKINTFEADISKLADADFPKKRRSLRTRLDKSENIKETWTRYCLKFLLWCGKQLEEI